jgi:hypothetical protein
MCRCVCASADRLYIDDESTLDTKVHGRSGDHTPNHRNAPGNSKITPGIKQRKSAGIPVGGVIVREHGRLGQ